jgi:hypothetical protein
VPYAKGYYAEFKVKNLSEFRLNSGGVDKNSYLPLNLLNFTVQKSADVTQLNWSSASEINIRQFEIQVAKGNNALSTTL